jgi:hypothetical protein
MGTEFTALDMDVSKPVYPVRGEASQVAATADGLHAAVACKAQGIGLARIVCPSGIVQVHVKPCLFISYSADPTPPDPH